MVRYRADRGHSYTLHLLTHHAGFFPNVPQPALISPWVPPSTKLSETETARLFIALSPAPAQIKAVIPRAPTSPILHAQQHKNPPPKAISTTETSVKSQHVAPGASNTGSSWKKWLGSSSSSPHGGHGSEYKTTNGAHGELGGTPWTKAAYEASTSPSRSALSCTDRFSCEHG